MCLVAFLLEGRLQTEPLGFEQPQVYCYAVPTLGASWHVGRISSYVLLVQEGDTILHHQHRQYTIRCVFLCFSAKIYPKKKASDNMDYGAAWSGH